MALRRPLERIWRRIVGPAPRKGRDRTGHMHCEHAATSTCHSLPGPFACMRCSGAHPRFRHDRRPTMTGNSIRCRRPVGLDVLALSRSGATTPALLHWFDRCKRGQAVPRAGLTIRLPARLRGPGITPCGGRSGRCMAPAHQGLIRALGVPCTSNREAAAQPGAPSVWPGA